MTAKQRFLRVTNLLFLVLVAVQFLPDQIKKDPETAYVLWFAVGVEVLVLAASALIKKQEGLTLFLDIAGFLYVLLILWTLATAKLNLDDIVSVVTGQGNETACFIDVLLEKDFIAGTVGTDDMCFRNDIAESLTLFPVHLDNGDIYIGINEQRRKINAYPAAAHDDGVLYRSAVFSRGYKELSDLIGRSRDLKSISAPQNKIAVWNEDLIFPLYHSDEDLRMEQAFQILKLHAVQPAVFTDSVLN